MKDYFEYLDKHMPNWRMSIYQVLEHKGGKSTKTGEYEVVLGCDRWVVSSKSKVLDDAYVESMDKALAIEAKNANKDTG